MTPLETILHTPVLQWTIHSAFGNKPWQTVERPGTIILKLNAEPEEENTRILILKPNGFTANSLHELNSHPEARHATIEVKGAIRPGKRGFVVIKNCVKIAYYPTRDAPLVPGFPYARDSQAEFVEKSARERFTVVKPGGFGFYHNLLNLTPEWLVLILTKKINLAKTVDVTLLEKAGEKERKILLQFLEKVETDGDGIFSKHAKEVAEVLKLEPEKSLPALITFLNTMEAGKHEQCTVFAVILKIGRRHPEKTLKQLRNALKIGSAPPYYLKQLIEKIKRK